MVHLYFHVIWSDRKNNITGGSASGIDHHFGARCVRTEKCAEPVCAIGLRYNTTESRCVKDRRFRRHKVHHHHHQQQQNGRRHHLRHRHHHHEDMFEENDDNEDDENEHWFD
ncbi:hypothetical protein BLOT_016341 [Blomia tropicalis]|nr:hypothetical protein BLOT_016341 [Blomia tropicalis]